MIIQMKLNHKTILAAAVAFLSCITLHAQSAFDRGMDAINKGDYKSALEYMQQEVRSNPTNATAYYFMGLLHDDNGDLGQALKAYDLAIKNSKKDKELLSDCYKCRGNVYLQLKKQDEALADFNLAIKTNSKNADAYDERGNLYYLLEEYDKSDQDYQKAVKLEPDDPRHRIGLGRNAEKRENYQSALEYYTQAVAIKPDYGAGYRFRAGVHAEQKNFEAFAMDIVKALELQDNAAFRAMQVYAKDAKEPLLSELKTKAVMNPRASQWNYYRAVVCEINEDYKEAIDFYVKSNSIYPSPVTDLRIASCYDNLCQWDKSLEYVEAAIAKDPDDENNLITRAGYKYSLGDYEGAIADVSTCIELHPDLDWLYQKRGWYESNMRRWDAAFEDFSRAVELNPEYAHAYMNRGSILLRRGEKEKANEDFRMALEYDPDIENTNLTAPYAFVHLGLYEEAESWMKRIIDYRIENDYKMASTYYEATCVFSLMGKTEEAIDYLEKAIAAGHNDFYHYLQDSDLDNIRNSERFKSLLRSKWPAVLENYKHLLD